MRSIVLTVLLILSPAVLAIDCEADREDIDVIRICLKSGTCPVSQDDVRKLVRYGQLCKVPAFADGCTIFNPLDERDYELSPEQCADFYADD